MPITRNEVITAGEMLRPRRDHYGNTRFTLLVSRYDMDTVYVPVFCRIRIPENIKAHDRILVKGSLISFRERIGEGQYSPVLEIDAHEITKQEETGRSSMPTLLGRSTTSVRLPGTEGSVPAAFSAVFRSR